MRSKSLSKSGSLAAAAIVAVSFSLPASVGQAADIAVLPVVVTPPAPPVEECDNTFLASATILYMTRRDPAPTPLVTDAAPGDVLDAADFTFGWRDGFEGRVGYIHCRIGFDVGGFMLRSWVSNTVETTLGFSVVLETTPVTNTIEPDAMLALNETELDGADANILFRLSPNLTIFAGAAYVRLEDYLLIRLAGTSTAPNSGGLGDYSWNVLNSMIGPQIGFRATLGSMMPGTFFVGADARAGILFNRISNDLLVVRADGNVTGTDTITAVSPMFGGALKVGFQATGNISITAGYRALWLGNVALAPDQVSQSPNLNVAPGAIGIGTTAGGNFLAHGVELGIHLNF